MMPLWLALSALLEITTARLDNGLTVLVCRDFTVSDVAVELWFRAGSSDEPAGQTGIAHLMEHMLPPPSRVLGNDANRQAARRDSLDSNGSTSVEYTNMYIRVPASSVELAIAMAADRATASADTLTDADLTRNREIVLGEFRNSAGRAWDPVVATAVRRVLFGSTHPYAHAVLGSVDDVGAVTTDSIRRWFRSRYGASNTMLVVSGNVDAAQVIALVKKYFGSMPPGDPMPLAIPRVAPRDRRATLDLAVPQAKRELLLAWTTPPWRDPSRQDVAIAKEILRKRLAAKLACDVADGDEFTASAGGETSLRISCPEKEREALAELDRLLASSPAIAEARDAKFAALATNVTRLGWRSSRAQLLGEGLWLAGDPRAYEAQLSRIAKATTASVMTAAKAWLANPVIVRLSSAVVEAASDRNAPLSIPEPVARIADVEESAIHGVRVLRVKRTMPVVIGRFVGSQDAESFSTTPERLAEVLEKHGQPVMGVVLVGAGEVELPELEAAAKTRAPLAADAVTVIADFAGADPGRVGIAADLLRVRLNNRIREQERWSYNVDVRADDRTIIVQTAVQKEVAQKALAIIREQLEALPNEKLNAADATRARASVLRRLMALSSAPSELADALVEVIRSGLSYRDYVEQQRALEAALRDGTTLGIPEPSLR